MNKAFDDQPVVVFIPPSICYMLHIDILKFKKKKNYALQTMFFGITTICCNMFKTREIVFVQFINFL